MLAIAGVPLRIQELLGHKSIVTTERHSLRQQQQGLYYDEIAEAVAPGFVASGVVQTDPPEAPSTQNIQRKE